MWTRRGTTPSVQVLQGYKNFYVYSSASPRRGDQFSLFLPEVNTEMMNLYLKEFAAEYRDERVLLIMDQAGWHRSKDLCVPPNIELLFLPPYSPELNPVERLWRHLKLKATHNILFASLDQIMDALQEALKLLDSESIRSICRCNYMCHYI